MKSLLMAAVIVGGCIYVGNSVFSASSPKDQVQYSATTLLLDQDATASVTISNNSESTLTVVGLRSSCSCIRMQDAPLKIPPGKSEILTVKNLAPCSLGMDEERYQIIPLFSKVGLGRGLVVVDTCLQADSTQSETPEPLPDPLSLEKGFQK